VRKTVDKRDRISRGKREKSRFILPAPVTLTVSAGSYPKKLRLDGVLSAEPLYAIGNLNLLNLPGVAVIGSRYCSHRGFDLATRIAGAIAESGFTVVSGYAKGTDTAAHLGALQCHGSTIFVLPLGISHFRLKRELKELVTSLNFLALSQFPPKQPWFVSAAMKRNRLICALADAVLVIEAGEGGGTAEGARVAKELGKPLYVIQYTSPPPSAVGNQVLISQLSAHPIRSWRDVMGLIENLHQRSSNSLARWSAPVQESLF